MIPQSFFSAGVVQLCELEDLLALRATCTELRDLVNATATRLRFPIHKMYPEGCEEFHRFLQKFPRLIDLGVTPQTHFTSLIPEYTNLITLSLEGRGRSLKAVHAKALSNLKHVNNLSLRVWIISDESMGHLSRMTNLTHLDLNTSRVSPGRGTRAISRLTNLTKLNLLRVHEFGNTKDLVRTTRRMGNLNTLNCKNHLNHITDDFIKDLAMHWHTLTDLDIGCCISQSITDSSLRDIARLPTLTRLRLPPSPMVTDEGLRSISQCTTLTNLHIESCFRITDDGVNALASLTNLKNLDIVVAPRVTDRGVHSLAFVKTLRMYDCASDRRSSLENKPI